MPRFAEKIGGAVVPEVVREVADHLVFKGAVREQDIEKAFAAGALPKDAGAALSSLERAGAVTAGQVSLLLTSFADAQRERMRTILSAASAAGLVASAHGESNVAQYEEAVLRTTPIDYLVDRGLLTRSQAVAMATRSSVAPPTSPTFRDQWLGLGQRRSDVVSLSVALAVLSAAVEVNRASGVAWSLPDWLVLPFFSGAALFLAQTALVVSTARLWGTWPGPKVAGLVVATFLVLAPWRETLTVGSMVLCTITVAGGLLGIVWLARGALTRTDFVVAIAGAVAISLATGLAELAVFGDGALYRIAVGALSGSRDSLADMSVRYGCVRLVNGLLAGGFMFTILAGASDATSTMGSSLRAVARSALGAVAFGYCIGSIGASVVSLVLDDSVMAVPGFVVIGVPVAIVVTYAVARATSSSA